MLWFFKHNHYNLVTDYPHVWIGVTAENQEQANLRGKMLNQIQANVKFVSIEPMLTRVDFFVSDLFYVGGGEYGPI